MSTTINLTAAIRNGLIDFDKALELQGVTMTVAIREGILTFEEAVELQGLTSTVEADTMPEKPKAKPKKQAKKAAPKPKAEEPKAEVSPEREGFSYTKGGAIIQYAGNNTLKSNHMRRVNYALQKLVKAGFCVSWKRVGSWLYIYHDSKADKKSSKAYQAVKLPEGWQFIKGAWVDNTMLADYEDNFRK